MPKYLVTGVVTGSKHLGTFEAESEEAAADMALESGRASVNLCHQCSSECEDGQITNAIASLEQA